MSDLLFLISEEGIAVFVIVVLLVGIAVVGRWFATYFASRMDSQFTELLREVAEMQQLIIENNNKLYSITEQLINNQRLIGEDVNNIEGSLKMLLAFINKNGKK